MPNEAFFQAEWGKCDIFLLFENHFLQFVAVLLRAAENNPFCKAGLPYFHNIQDLLLERTILEAPTENL